MARVRYGHSTTFLPRHIGGANFLFRDGHAKVIMQSNIMSNEQNSGWLNGQLETPVINPVAIWN